MKIIPHRDPILLVDEAELLSAECVEAKFYVRPDMEIFKGHFPSEPVFPGVYSIECMGQASDVMMLSLDRYKNTIPLFWGTNNVRFYKKISPGSTIVIKSTLAAEDKEKRKVTCAAEIYLNDEKAAAAEIIIAFR